MPSYATVTSCVACSVELKKFSVVELAFASPAMSMERIASSMASLSKIRSVPTLTVVSSSLPSTSPVLSVNFVAALPSE